MSYVYKIQPSRALRTIYRNNLQTFSGSSHTRTFNDWIKKSADKKANPCFSIAFYGFKKTFFGEISGSDISGGPTGTDEERGVFSYCKKCKFKPLKIREKRTRNVSEYHSLSKRTKIKLRNKILATYQASRQKIKNKVGFSFLTLTVIEKIHDKKAAQLLNTFLTSIKKKLAEKICYADQHGNLKRKSINRINYIWVAERQGNGRIHFHIIINKNFSKEQKLWINKVWAKIQIDAGMKHEININRERIKVDGKYKYVDTKDSKKVVCTKEIFFDYYHNKITANNLFGNGVESVINSADITTVYDSNFLAAYLSGYVSKNNQLFECRAWHCSRGVSGIYTDKLISFNEFLLTRREKLNTYKTKKGVEYKRQIFKNEYCEIVSIVNKKYFQKYYKDMSILNAYILNWTNEERKKYFIENNPYFETVSELVLTKRTDFQMSDVKFFREVKTNYKLKNYFESNSLQRFKCYENYLMKQRIKYFSEN